MAVSEEELREALTEHGRWLDAEGAEGRQADLHEADLRGLGLREVRLQQADLRGAQLQGADLTRADLQEAELGEALLDLVAWARQVGLDPEEALRGAVSRLGDRVRAAEAG